MDRRIRSLALVVFLAGLVAAGVVVVSSRGGAGAGGSVPVAWLSTAFVVVAAVMIFVVASGRRSGQDPAGSPPAGSPPDSAPRPADPPPEERPARTGRADDAADLGLRYEEQAEKGFHHAFGPLPSIPRGGEVRHVMSGDLDGRPLTIFQHTYTVNTGQATIPVHHVVFATSAPHWPITVVRRRGVLGRLLRRLGQRRGLLLEDEAFNAACRVSADDEDFALTLLHPEMQAFIAQKPGVTWAVHPGVVAMIYSGSLKFDRIDRSIDRFRAFWDRVPPELERW